MLQVKNLTVSYGRRAVVKDVSFSVCPGQWLMVVGPNGAGKSSLINAVSQSIPFKGNVLLNGQETKGFSPRRLARAMAVLMQQYNVNYSFTAEEIVRLGRYCYSSGFWDSPNADDDFYVEQALQQTGLLSLRRQPAPKLSGGELQRVFLAQVLAQNSPLLVLDEPANHLDLVYQKQVFTLLQQWLAAEQRALISVVHDLTLAKAYGTHALLLDKGNCIATGKIKKVLTPQNLQMAYGVDVDSWMKELISVWK